MGIMGSLNLYLNILFEMFLHINAAQRPCSLHCLLGLYEKLW